MASLRWHVAGKSECSAKCGSGYRSLDVQCVKYSLVKRQSQRVDSSVCANAIKPRTRETCHGDCLLKSWQYGAWSEVPLTAATLARGSRLGFDHVSTSSRAVLQDVRAREPRQRAVLHEQPGPAPGGPGVQRAPKSGHRKLQRPAVSKVVPQRVERGGNLSHSNQV